MNLLCNQFKLLIRETETISRRKNVNIIHLNTGVNLTSAPYKLHEALLQAGVRSKILVLNEGSELSCVEKVSKSIFYKCKRKLYAFFRKAVMKGYSLTEYMPFTALPVGMDLSKMSCIKEADAILLHWVCGDYMSPKTIQKLIQMKKPVFLACHDNYPFTGGCHVRMGCTKYREKCGRCPQLHSPKEQDITNRLLTEKKKRLRYSNVYAVSPSRWMDQNIAMSAVLGNQEHFILPNAVDTDRFHPFDKRAVREEFRISFRSFVILAGLKANEKIPYNGTEYMWEIFQKLSEGFPDGKWKERKIEIVVFGVKETDRKEIGGLSISNAGYISEADRLAKLYSAADVYLVTSLEDSFNQTVAECMACGTPAAAFKNGGIEDIIDHKENGYLAEYKNAEDLAEGIIWTAEYADTAKGREKIVREFSYASVSRRFLDIMEKINRENR